MNDRVVDDPAAVLDPTRVRKLLDDLVHLSPALEQMVELAQGGPGSEALKRKKHHDRGNLSRRIGPAAIRAPSCELRDARRGHSNPPPQVVKSAKFPKLVADYADGLTQVQIAKKHGLHVQTVRRRLIEAGVDTRARLRVLADEDLRAARAAVDNGASIREIARGLGVPHTTVARSLARRHEASGSPSRTTRTRSRSNPTPVRARKSPLRTTPETSPDQGKYESKPAPASRYWGRTWGE